MTHFCTLSVKKKMDSYHCHELVFCISISFLVDVWKCEDHILIMSKSVENVSGN